MARDNDVLGSRPSKLFHFTCCSSPLGNFRIVWSVSGLVIDLILMLGIIDVNEKILCRTHAT